MTIQGRDKILAIAVPLALLAVFLVFVGYGWMEEHDARLKAETETGQQQKQIAGLQQQQAVAQQTLVARLASIEKERQRPATAAQLVSDAARLQPSLPQPLQVRASPIDPALPDAPQTEDVVIPAADLPAIRDAQIACEENSAKLNACQSVSDESKQQLKLTEDQRDEWKTAAKGGSIWHRALGAAKWFAIGAGAGAGVYAATHHK